MATESAGAARLSHSFQVLLDAVEFATSPSANKSERNRLELSFLLRSNTPFVQSTAGQEVAEDRHCWPENESYYLSNSSEKTVIDSTKEKTNEWQRSELVEQRNMHDNGLLQNSMVCDERQIVNRQRPPPIRIQSFGSGTSCRLGFDSCDHHTFTKNATGYLSEVTPLSSSALSPEGYKSPKKTRKGRKRTCPYLTEEQRRQLRTMRNREAAERARNRRREREIFLEQELKRLLVENRKLEEELQLLQVMRLVRPLQEG